MFCWRITKYDPAYRKGIYYLNKEWSAYSDLGKTYNGKLFKIDEYLATEATYIQAILAFMERLNVPFLTIKTIEKKSPAFKAVALTLDRKTLSNLANNKAVSKEQIAFVVQLILREKMWCRLEAKKMFVHFGWDYYMYIGAVRRSNTVFKQIRESGLFIEVFQSPYLETI